MTAQANPMRISSLIKIETSQLIQRVNCYVKHLKFDKKKVIENNSMMLERRIEVFHVKVSAIRF